MGRPVNATTTVILTGRESSYEAQDKDCRIGVYLLVSENRARLRMAFDGDGQMKTRDLLVVMDGVHRCPACLPRFDGGVTRRRESLSGGGVLRRRRMAVVGDGFSVSVIAHRHDRQTAKLGRPRAMAGIVRPRLSADTGTHHDNRRPQTAERSLD
ncbi:hypothetical protein Dimus_017584 [Dionaea muscipula]